MNKPSLDKLMSKSDSRYTLVVAGARRARELTEAHNKLNSSKAFKAVTIALQEIAEGKISFERTKSGIK